MSIYIYTWLHLQVHRLRSIWNGNEQEKDIDDKHFMEHITQSCLHSCLKKKEKKKKKKRKKKERKKRKKEEDWNRMTASVLNQDPNTNKFKRTLICFTSHNIHYINLLHVIVIPTIFKALNKRQKLNQNKISFSLSFFVVLNRLSVV